MFLISSPVQAVLPSSSNAASMVNSCAQEASAAGHIGSEFFNLNATKALKKLSISSTGSASSCGSSSGGLRRTVSSLHGMPEMCSHQDDLSKCIVQAKQVEIDFSSQSSKPFYITIKAPNGEISKRLDFHYGQTAQFTPKRHGCGHGQWTITVHELDTNGKVVQKVRETLSLDGVGSLFFEVEENLQLRLASQEFLRLPSASQCCSSRKHG